MYMNINSKLNTAFSYFREEESENVIKKEKKRKTKMMGNETFPLTLKSSEILGRNTNY